MEGNERRNMGDSQVKEVKESFHMPIMRYFTWRGGILDFRQHMNDKTQVSFNNKFGKMMLLGYLKTLDQHPEFHCTIRACAHETIIYSKDFPINIPKYSSIVCQTWISFRSTIEIKLDELWWVKGLRGR